MLEIRHETEGLVSKGVSACAGCGLEIVMRNVMEALDEDVIVVIPPGCSALFWSGDKSKDTRISGEFGEYGCQRIWNTHSFGCKGKYSHDSAVFCGRWGYGRYWATVIVRSF